MSVQPIIDVVIVGAGSVSAFPGARLAAAGRSVVMFEAGPRCDAQDLVSSQIWSRRLRWGGPPVASTIADPVGFGFNAGWGTVGAALHHYATWPRMHAANMIGMCEAEPNPDNRVELGDGSNAWGVRPARLVHRFSDDAKRQWAAMRDEGTAIFKAGGATETWHTPMGSAHFAGGVIMGRDAATSVTDSFGRVHGLDNLYVTGSGLFPTEGSVNPAFNSQALALRTADHFAADRGDLFNRS